MNYLGNVIGAGASQDAEQAKAALLNQAVQAAAFRNGNQQRDMQRSKEEAMAALGLRAKEGDANRQMQMWLAQQANDLKKSEMAQQNAQFGQKLGAEKELQGAELGSREKIAASRDALEQKKVELEDEYHKALVSNDLIRANALKDQHAALTAQINQQTQQSAEKFQYGPEAIERDIFKGLSAPAANKYVGPPGVSDTGEVGVKGDTGTGAAISGLDPNKIALLHLLKTGETPADSTNRQKKAGLELDLLDAQIKAAKDQMAGVVPPAMQRENQRKASGELESMYSGLVADPTIDKTQAQDRALAIINDKYAGDLQKPLDKAFFSTPGANPLISTSPQAINQAIAQATGGKFLTANDLRLDAENSISAGYNQDVPTWKKLAGLAGFAGPREVGALLGSYAATPYLPEGTGLSAADTRYRRQYIKEHPDLDLKLRQKLRNMVALPQEQGNALLTQTE